MELIYDFFIFLYTRTICLSALLGNQKAKFWIEGRISWREKLINTQGNKAVVRIWIHCASLGEFEQGRPLIEKLRIEHPEAFIILSFFSPSGYNVRKEYDKVNKVVYLPSDTKTNARDFIKLISPTHAIFIKYEFWFNYFTELQKQNIPVLLVSAIFRQRQIFFKWYGFFFRRLLKTISYFYVQDEISMELLKGIGLNNVMISGDTRFDRVKQISLQPKEIMQLDKFKSNSFLIIAGSTWERDEEILLKVMTAMAERNVKLVIVPHEVTDKRITNLTNEIKKNFSENNYALYSKNEISGETKILIIDTIGILSSAYKYADTCWVGGGFDKGIHNVLEAAVFTKPVLFGPEYKKFREAEELIALRGAIAVKDITNAITTFELLISDQQILNEYGENAGKYVEDNTGASDLIIQSINIK